MAQTPQVGDIFLWESKFSTVNGSLFLITRVYSAKEGHFAERKERRTGVVHFDAWCFRTQKLDKKLRFYDDEYNKWTWITSVE